MTTPPTDPGQKFREGIRIAIRVVLSMGAALASAIAAGALFADDGIGIRIAVGLFMLVIGWAPLVGHILWGRRHPIEARPRRTPQFQAPQQFQPPQRFQAPHQFAPPQRFAAPQQFAQRAPSPDSLMGLLQQARGAAHQLSTRSWIAPQDSAAIDQRISRLTDLAVADDSSQRFGGTASPGLRREVQELHGTVLGLLDAAIESAAVAPGDRDIDNRLTAHLDRLHSRGAAVAELENALGQTGTA